MFDLEGELARSYRLFFSNTKEDSIIFSLKKMIYRISLFVAKKRGYLPYFFSKKEKNFDFLKLDEQYQIFLKNDKHDLELNKENTRLSLIDLVLFADGQEENTKTILELVSAHNNFNLYIISIKHSSNYFESILGNLNIKKYKVIKQDQGEKIQRILNNIVSESKSDFMFFLDSTKGTIHNDSLYWISKFCKKDIDVIYCDSDFINIKRGNPFFKPGWSPQLLYSFNYIGNFVIYSTSLLKTIGGFDETIISYEYDFLLRVTKVTDKVTHISKILFSEFEENKNYEIKNDKFCLQNFLKKEQIDSEIISNQSYFSIKNTFESEPLISIIIPTKNSGKLLLKCIKSIQKSTYNNYEIIIMNNGNKIESLFGINCKIINYDEPFNFSRLNNVAALSAKGEYLLFLNDDTEVINSDWIEYMMFHSLQKKVGIVGSLLLFPKSRFYPTVIQHAGVTVGIAGPAIHSFSYSHHGKNNYQNLDKVSRNVSSVTAACMMVRKNIFEEIGGFDEEFVVVFGDIDLCLRIKEKGYQIVYCPNARLYHAESATRGSKHPQEDEIKFLNRWEDNIISGDKFYNPNLTHINRNYRISPYPAENPAVSVLKEIVFFREDLQKEVKDVDKNIDYMIDWAAVQGVTVDIARTVLVPYNKFYLDNSSEKIKKIAGVIYKFNHSIELQKKFPEVFSGKYDKLLSSLKIK